MITRQAADLDGDRQVNDVKITVKTAWGSFISPAVLVSTPPLLFTPVGAGESSPAFSARDPGSYPITFEVHEAGKTSSYVTINFIIPDPDAPSVENLESDQAFFDIATSNRVYIDVEQDTVLTGPPDNDDLNGGYLKLNMASGTAEAVLSVVNEGAAAGPIGVAGSNVTYGGLVLGTINSTEDGDGTPDRLDADADNDGLPDRFESGRPPPLGTDSDSDRRSLR